jgi:predicted dehydrogenase
MKKLKIGIIGCGFIANRKHLPCLARMKGVEVIAFCNPTVEKAQASANEFGSPKALVCTDYHEVLARQEIDAVHVCTPNSSHAEISIAALHSGKHVLCEKPMAKTATEAKSMLEASRQTGKLLTVGYNNRFREDALFLKSLSENGDLGEIYFAKALATRRRGVPTWGSFMDKEKQGGGPLIDLATHALDLALWIMENYEPVSVFGATFDKLGRIGSPANSMGPWNPAKYEVEDSAFGLVKFSNGATVMVEASWALNMMDTHEAMVVLCGTKAGADMFPPSAPGESAAKTQLDYKYHVRVNGERNGELFVQNYAFGPTATGSEQPDDYRGGLKEMRAWIGAIRGENELVVKPEQAYVVSGILEAIYNSAASGDIVRLG